jgi:hypothetical protein
MRAASGDLFTPRAAGTRSRTGATPELVIREDGRFVGGDREAATAAVLTVLEQPVGERSVAVHALPLDDADFRTSFPDAYARLRRGVDALGTALRLLVRGRATYSVTWTVEQLVDAVLELRAICLPAQGDREDWYAWPVDRPTEVHTVRLDPRWVRWFATGAFRWTPDNEPVDGAPPDAPLWLRYVDPALVWGRLVPALLAELAVDGLALDQSNGDHVVLDEWVISNRRPTELASQRPVEPRE